MYVHKKVNFCFQSQHTSELFLFFSTAVHKYFRYGLSCYNSRKLKDLESWNYSMASNCPHAYRKTWVCAYVILVPSKTIGIGFMNLNLSLYWWESRPWWLQYYNRNCLYIAVWSSIGFEIDYVKIVCIAIWSSIGFKIDLTEL